MHILDLLPTDTRRFGSVQLLEVRFYQLPHVIFKNYFCKTSRRHNTVHDDTMQRMDMLHTVSEDYDSAVFLLRYFRRDPLKNDTLQLFGNVGLILLIACKRALRSSEFTLKQAKWL